MERKYKILILVIFFTFSFIVYQTITHKTEITKFIVKTILEHKKENAFEFVNKFISVVPNYANKDGFEIVSKEDYEKYQQGYCLAENRILDKKELYKRAIGEYLDKQLKIDKMIDEWRGNNYDLSWKNILEIGYYILNTTNLLHISDEFLNIEQEVSKIRGNLTKRIKTKEVMFADKFEPKIVNPMNYLELDLTNKIASFKIPILFNSRNNQKIMYFDNVFLLCNDGVSVLSFYYPIPKKVNWKYDTKQNCEAYHKMDNCGYINLNIKKVFMKSREAKGG